LSTSLIRHLTPPAVKTEILKDDVSKGSRKHDGNRGMHREIFGEEEERQEHQPHNQCLDRDGGDIPHLVILVK